MKQEQSPWDQARAKTELLGCVRSGWLRTMGIPEALSFLHGLTLDFTVLIILRSHGQKNKSNIRYKNKPQALVQTV